MTGARRRVVGSGRSRASWAPAIARVGHLQWLFVNVDVTVGDARGVWLREVTRSRANCADRPLDRTSPFRGGDVALRWIYTHMIAEYARHIGHADLIRERIDGSTGF